MSDNITQVPLLPVQVGEPVETAPVREVTPMALQALTGQLQRLFDTYKADRRIAEYKWMRNLRQYLGLYDPEIESQLTVNRSRAYPRMTRVKCISTLSRVMNMMFPGNERNWDLQASPSADMKPEDVQAALQKMMERAAKDGVQMQPDEENVQNAVNDLANERALRLRTLIDDQLQELGGDQTLDYIALNRQVVQSGVRYGIGVLKGPMVRTQRNVSWGVDPMTGMPAPTVRETFKPQFEFLPIWDFYPDMSAKNLSSGADGWFERLVMTRSQVRALANRSDFFGNIIKGYLSRTPTGNYVQQTFETELRTLGVSINVNMQKHDTQKYEVIVWHGPVSGQQLRDAGEDVADDKLADDVEAEIWMLGDSVIKAKMNPWRALGHDVKTAHVFIFDEDDSSPVGNGLPSVIRDSQMSVSAATRMLLDNAGVVCGPQLELNTALLRADQDLGAVYAYKSWYRDDDGPTAQWPAVRNVQIDGHLTELLAVIKQFMDFADTESFISPATGGDVQRGSGEPMRTAAGASMLRGEAALPFRDIIRNFDTFTQSVIVSMVMFNRIFNPAIAEAGDYNVVARGATSLIAKELRGIQVDSLATTLTPAEMEHIDERKLVTARLGVRDMQDVLVSPAEAERRKAMRLQSMSEQADQQKRLTEATIRETLTQAFKNITQGQKNAAGADAQAVNAALSVLMAALEGANNGSAETDGAPAGTPRAANAA